MLMARSRRQRSGSPASANRIMRVADRQAKRQAQETRDAFHGAAKQNFVGAARIGVTEAFRYSHAKEMADDECGAETVPGAGRVNLLHGEGRAMNCATLVVVGGPLRAALDHYRSDAAVEKRRYRGRLVALGA